MEGRKGMKGEGDGRKEEGREGEERKGKRKWNEGGGKEKGEDS